jgi:uncharacterized protein YggU (UPF0235/DUF167 family)
MSGSADAFRIDGDDLILRLKVTPGARSEGVAGLTDGPGGARLIRLKVRAKAQDNAANEAVIAALTAHLPCSRSAVTLESGRTARVKSLRVAGGAALAGRLKELIGE